MYIKRTGFGSFFEKSVCWMNRNLPYFVYYLENYDCWMYTIWYILWKKKNIRWMYKNMYI